MASSSNHAARGTSTAGYLPYLIPGALGFIAVVLVPFIMNIGASFTRWNGIGNYLQMVNDPLFWHSLGITLRYTLISVPARMVLALGVEPSPCSDLERSGL